jgi:hypothetical protein
MGRTICMLMKRDPSRDRREGERCFEGYAILWPDGRPVGVGLDAFCRHGQRLFGLGRELRGRAERLVEMTFYPLAGIEDDLTRLPGRRIRRFFLKRQGRRATLHFLDGTPTAVGLDLDRDEPRVLEWAGCSALRDGETAWFDLAARAVDADDGPGGGRP